MSRTTPLGEHRNKERNARYERKVQNFREAKKKRFEEYLSWLRTTKTTREGRKQLEEKVQEIFKSSYSQEDMTKAIRFAIYKKIYVQETGKPL